ncbi:MAG: LptF/LptG family permease [Planctomycetes bacterium]|nr:LptF/LptG family permease [Planctomycetota bacterium]
MQIIDRYILTRFLSNFVILFSLLYLFAVAIDLILNLDEFVDAARDDAGEDTGRLRYLLILSGMIIDFQAPRFFQFYAYLHGLLAIGAMGFTLAQMHKFRELVAVLASGVSLQRIAMPFIVGMFLISLAQLANQEFFLPRVAPLLLRSHGGIGKTGLDSFPVTFAKDGKGNLLQAPQFDPGTNRLYYPTFLQRTQRGITSVRISADYAEWDENRKGWRLNNGLAIAVASTQDTAADEAVLRKSINFHHSEISPQTLIVSRYSQFAGMLSLRQINEMLKTPEAIDAAALTRHRFSRFSTVMINILVLVITLPSFLLREPANLLVQSVICAGLAIPCMFGALLGMMVTLPGISPAASVFLPAFILIPVALARVTFIKT